MRPLSAGAQLAALMSVTGTASTAYGVGRLSAARRARRLRRLRGFTYQEALSEGLLDPVVSDLECRWAVSKHLMMEMQSRVNPRELIPLTEDKAIFSLFCEAAGLPVPHLYGIVGRSAGWVGSAAVDGPEAFARLVATELPEHFVVKPSSGYHGTGVALMRRVEDRLVDHRGDSLAPEELYRRLVADPRFGLHLIQERVYNHPAIVAEFATQTLQTLRLMTYVDAAGEARLLYGVARIASGGGPVDNIADGRHGNCYAVISLEDGRLGPPQAAYLHVEPGPLPDSEGFRVPLWEEARALVVRSAPAMLPVRAIGWDVAVAPDGPVLIEANAAFDPWPGGTFGRAMAVIGAE